MKWAKVTPPTLTGLLIGIAAWFYIGDRTPDFLVFHAAARAWPGPIYDAEYLHQFQFGRAEAYPWAYPPTFLLMLLPLRWLSFQAAYALWVAGSVVALLEASRLLAGRWAYLLLLSPILLLAAVNGQSSIIVAAAAVAGLALKDRPVASGLLLALAACIKPQLLVLAPIGLLIAGRWRDTAAMGLIGLAACALSASLLGLNVWLDWFAALPGFLEINRQMGLPGLAPEALWMRVVLGAVSVALVYHAFCGDDRVVQSMAALGGPLLFGEHIMRYDAVMIAPAALAMALRSKWWEPLYVLFLFRLLLSWPLILGLLIAATVQSGASRRLAA